MRRVLVVVCLAGCGDNLVPAFDAQRRPDAGPDPCPIVPGEPALALERVAAGLDKPVALASPPGDPRMFVVEQVRGAVRIIDEQGVLLDGTFLELGDQVGSNLEQGLLSIAFHPGYAQNGLFYLSWARDSDEALVVEEWRASGDPSRADPASRRTLLEVEHTETYHYGGHLEFGPDELLYVSVGDGDSPRDPGGYAQDLGSLRGKILRIDVDAVDGERPYAIPADNPFVDVPGARPEIWAYGLRNPWRFAIDPLSRHMFIGDVGHNSTDELNVLPYRSPGLNFGWAIYEGSSECLIEDACDTPDLTWGVYTYGHAFGCAVIGGPVYRGCAMPGHHGKVFFGDYCEGWVKTAIYSNGTVEFVTDHPELNLQGALSSFGVDALGEIYMLDVAEGTVDRIVPAP